MRTNLLPSFCFALLVAILTGLPAHAQPAPKTARELIESGTAALQKGDFVKASQEFTEAIGLDPKAAQAYVGRGTARGRLGSTERAIADFDEAIRLDPKLAAAFHARGLAFRAEGSRLKAVADFTEAIRLDPQLAAAFNDRAVVYTTMRAYDKATADCTEALRLNPKLVPAYRNRGYALYLQGEDDKALTDLTEAIKLDPKNPALLLDRSQCHIAKATDLAAALRDANDAIKLDPKNPSAYGQRAAVRFAQGEWAEERKDLDEAIRLGPNQANLYVARATLLACCPEAQERDAGRAFKDAERACELTAWKDPYALQALAAASAALRDFTGAAKWQRMALEDPDYAQFEPTGRARLVAFERNEVITFPPRIKDRTDPREFVARGDYFFKNRNFEDAIKDYNEAIKLDPKNAKAYYGRGSVWGRVDEYAKAVADLTEAIKLDPKDVSAYVDRGLVHVMRSRWELALADFDGALKLDPKHVSALTDRARIRATCADPTYRDAAKALKDARQACELSGWKLGYPLEGYATACAEAGDFEEAIKWLSKAETDEQYVEQRGEYMRYLFKMFEAKRPIRTGTPRKPD